MQTLSFPKPFTVILMSLAGAAIGVSVVLFQARSTPESQQFVDAPQFYVWIFLLGLSTAVMVISVALMLKPLQELKPHWRGHKIEITLSSLLMCLLFVVPLASSVPESGSVLVYHRIKMTILLVMGIVVSLQALVGIWLVNVALRTFQKTETPSKQIASFLRLREHLQRFLVILGTLVSLLTLSTGALRHTLVSARFVEEADFPVELVLVYGAYFTVLIALSYIPTYTFLIAVGRRICDALFPLSSLEAGSIGQWHSERKSLEALLHIQVGVGKSFGTGIAISAPLISGIISVLLSS
jgi:hypothetical protein